MGDAAKVIDWNGTDVPETLAALRPGRYRIEVVAEVDDQVLTPEMEAGIEAAMDEVAAGRAVSWDVARQEIPELLTRAQGR